MNYPRLVMRTEVRTTAQPAEYFMYLKRHIEDSGVDCVNFTRVGRLYGGDGDDSSAGISESGGGEPATTGNLVGQSDGDLCG